MTAEEKKQDAPQLFEVIDDEETVDEGPGLCVPMFTAGGTS